MRRYDYQFQRRWTVERVVGYLYSTSMPLRRLLGDQREAFEREIAAALADLASNDQLVEPVTLDVYTATRR
ncbi:hypothetical protein IU501_18695 [Nocardia otitidiscaviarum]|uniref:hypothetical protein n=1 Tax=Nocardia otitidiscaviarum TaxID=1823 RepID=UPI000B28ED10|nr:hypothetical protein [Nocardia otitidiscaviarum]MBF6135024.1 hypothetical protein [Nocardia otitidiscaviarum]MBF6486847.1 hypothetical protein [Nocardia otitidiscaviarum]